MKSNIIYLCLTFNKSIMVFVKNGVISRDINKLLFVLPSFKFYIKS